MMQTEANSSGTRQLLRRVETQDPRALPELFARHRERLRKMVRLRLDRRLRAQISSSAVLDQVCQEAGRRINEYQSASGQPFFLWLRQLTGQVIQGLHLKHLGTGEVGPEVSLYEGALPEANSVSLAAQLLGHMTEASHAVARADMQIHLQNAINGMDAMDREVLTLCHFEELTHAEAGLVLGIGKSAATQRYLRAFRRLMEILNSIPGFLTDSKS